MNNVRGWAYVIVSGLVLLAAAAFLALQWDRTALRSTFSAYGPQRTVPTLYFALGSAAGGLLVYWMLRLMVRGVRLLRRARRQRPLREAAEAPGRGEG